MAGGQLRGPAAQYRAAGGVNQGAKGTSWQWIRSPKPKAQGLTLGWTEVTRQGQDWEGLGRQKKVSEVPNAGSREG